MLARYLHLSLALLSLGERVLVKFFIIKSKFLLICQFQGLVPCVRWVVHPLYVGGPSLHLGQIFRPYLANRHHSTHYDQVAYL